MPKLVDMLLFSAEKTEFPFFEIPYFRVLPTGAKGLETTGNFHPGNLSFQNVLTHHLLESEFEPWTKGDEGGLIIDWIIPQSFTNDAFVF